MANADMNEEFSTKQKNRKNLMENELTQYSTRTKNNKNFGILLFIECVDVVQVMSSDEFSSLIVTLVRITWFASACKLEQLTANADVNVEGTSFMK